MKLVTLNCPRCGKEQQNAWHSRKVCCLCRIEEERDAARSFKGMAWRATAKAIRSGALVRSGCELCGAEKSEAHHDDYAKPLDVRWLCRSHHKQHHAKFGPGLNAYT